VKYILIVAFVVSTFTAKACDHCNIFLNIGPNDYKNRIGLYYRARFAYGTYTETGTILQPKHGGHGSTAEYWNNKINDTYSSIDLRGTFYHKEKWQTFVSIPMVMNEEKINDLSKYVINSVGDPWVVETYQIYNTKCTSDTIKFTQRISLGGGVKLPLGKVNYTTPLGIPNLDLQPGTGSFDFLVNLSYKARFKKFGLLTYANFKLNTANKNQYAYGKATNVTVNAFYIYELSKRIKIMPLSGIYMEYAGNDTKEGMKQLDTGGKTFCWNAGFSLFFNKMSLNFQYQDVIAQNLNGNTQLFTNHLIQTSINYNF